MIHGLPRAPLAALIFVSWFLAGATAGADEPRAQRELPKLEPTLVAGGRWDPFRILEGLSADFLVSPEPTGPPAAGAGPHDLGAHFAVAAAVLGGKGEMRRLLEDLIEKVESGITFLEPGREGRPPAVAARAQLERWRDRLLADRLTLVDLFHLGRWLRTYYAAPRFLSEESQMRLFLTLGARKTRCVERVPADGRTLAAFLDDGVGTGEFVVAGVDRNADGAIDEWVLLGKDRRSRLFAYAPWARARDSLALSTAVVRADADGEAFAKILKESVIFDQRDPDNPAQMIGRRVYRVGPEE